MTIAQEEAIARACFDDFIYWRKQTNNFAKLKREGRPIRDPAFTDERRLYMLEYVAWCRLGSVDPRLFMFALFSARNFLFGPPWGTFTSEKVLKRFQSGHFSNLDVYRKRIATAPLNVQQSSRFDPLIDMSAEVEARKEKYARLGLAEQCKRFMRDRDMPTLGYHPKSDQCQVCAIKEQCRSELPTYVVQVREGVITRDQANIIRANSR